MNTLGYIIGIGKDLYTNNTKYIFINEDGEVSVINDYSEINKPMANNEEENIDFDWNNEESLIFNKLHTDQWFKVLGVYTERLTGKKLIFYKELFGLKEDIFCYSEDFLYKKDEQDNLVYVPYKELENYNETIEQLKKRKDIQ